KSSHKAKIYIPRIFYFHDFLPFWSTLLWETGFEVEISGNTNRQIINRGIESIHVESCFPHKVAHGHIKDLSGRDADAVFVPSFINFNTGNEAARGFACPYVQSFPYVANVVFRGDGIFSDKIKLLKPVINMELGERYFLREIYSTLRPFSVSMNAIKKAFVKAEKAQMEFTSAIKARGKEVLENINEKTIIIAGRSYNAFDPGVNLEIPRKLSDLGILSIPMDYLPLENINIAEKWPNMYWRSGQNLLRAGEIIRDNPNLFAIYIGNFSCGPDSFISRYFKETMAGKPFLQIEIDEHSADAGVITRCEAFLDSIMKRKNISAGQPRKIKLVSLSHRTNNKIIYIPRMSDHALGLAAAFEACGLDAEVMPVPDIDTVKIGRHYVSGKECYPCTLTTGDMAKKALSGEFEPSRAAFFMPSGAGPCRFGQYNILHRLVLDEMGFPNVPIFSPNQDSSFYKELGIVGKDFTKRGWMGIVAIDLLIKCLHETRPYETNKGETDAVYNKYLLKTSRMVKSRNSDFDGLLSGMCGDFSRIPRTNGRKPLIGIIGEIFVRHNAFANEDIIRKIEALGGEVWLAPVEEWLYYVNSMALNKALIKWRNSFFSKGPLNDIIKIIITRLVQKNIEHKFSVPFRGFLKTLEEPSTNEIIKNASRYLHKSFEGEAILSIGKTIDFVKKGSSGIISTMPFGCMPGTIVSALLKGVKKDTGIPCLSIAYDGAEAASSEIQLEAFMHQAKEYKIT
ncbi:MAG: acyl-CoA dehydratase activase-related protein, partial [Nitrospirota bacterium]